MSINPSVQTNLNHQAPSNNESLVIKAPASLSIVEAQAFKNDFKSVIESDNPPLWITVDFTHTKFLDSSGVGALAGIIKMAKTSRIVLTVMGLSPQVSAVLEMTGLDRLIEDDYFDKKDDSCGETMQRPDADVETIAMPKEFTVVEAVPFRDNFSLICQREELPPRQVKLDFTQTDFIDSSGIGALASMCKIAKAAGVSLSVSGLSPQVRSVLTMTGMDKMFNVADEENSDKSSNKQSPKMLLVTHASIRSHTKRAIDIAGALVGLAITGLLFIPIAIAIKSESPGPLFFSQTRRGWMGKPFKLWKFRSMVVDAEARKSEIKNEAQGAIFKSQNDPRITKVGRFLRRTSLDELPQFWNVLQGSMSLVGTRPPTADEMDQYEVPQWRRLDVKPGITGEWQVNGRSSIKDFTDIIRLDLRYQRNWSLFYDIKLMFKTIAVIFSKDSGAM